MQKKAIFPYTSDGYGRPITGLAPGLPQNIEQPYMQGQPASSTAEKGLPSWLLPVGLAASGLVGWKMLKRMRGAQKGVAEAAGAAKASGGAAKAPRPSAGSSVTSAAPTKSPAVGETMSATELQNLPLEAQHLLDKKFVSHLYPKSPLGTRAGEVYESYIKQNPQHKSDILRRLREAAEGK